MVSLTYRSFDVPCELGFRIRVVGDWQEYVEPAPGMWGALNDNATADTFDVLHAFIHADSHSLGFGCLERMEQLLAHKLLCHASAVVRYLNHCLSRIRERADSNPPKFSFACLNCVLHDVSDNAFDAITVRKDALPSEYRKLLLAQMQHRLVFQALNAGESARAEALMREHAYIGVRYAELLGAPPESFAAKALSAAPKATLTGWKTSAAQPPT